MQAGTFATCRNPICNNDGAQALHCFTLPVPSSHYILPQSLANLSYSLEPLRLRPGPGWLTDLLRASGKLMVQQQQRQQQSTSQHAQWQGRGQGQWQGRGWGGTAGGRGRSLGEGGGGGVNYSELTQLAWGVFSMRRK